MNLLVVEDVAKAFRNYGSEWRRIVSWFGVRIIPHEENWVVQGVSFSIGPGEAVGIVGQNGAGKSTLLKMITGTLQPTRGDIRVQGRISAILELGMGFSPDLTGRQNALHAAGLMGFDRSAIDKVMPEIEAFAEIGEYFDNPVRTYSSGMQMRVAFAVATAFRPEILIVDEALSVGDAYFQHKSFDRIRMFQKMGTALLIVSHDRSAIQSLCGRAILLEQGCVLKDGAPEEVMDFYNALIADKENSKLNTVRLSDGRVQTVSGTGEAQVEFIGLFNQDDGPLEYVGVGEAVELRVRVKVNEPIPTLVLGYMIKDRVGQVIYGTNTWHTRQPLEDIHQGVIVEYSIRFIMNLGPGSYSISTALVSSDTHLVNNYEWRDLALVFSVINLSCPHFVGSAWLPPDIEIKIP